jgi:hypothetical protein
MAEPRDSRGVTCVCKACGSTNVASDAIAQWSVTRQAWIVVGHYDSGECLDCHDEGGFVEVELSPASA